MLSEKHQVASVDDGEERGRASSREITRKFIQQENDYRVLFHIVIAVR